MAILFYILVSLVISGLLFLFYRKMALQMQYLQIEKGQPPSPLKEFLFFDWGNAKARELRAEAFLLFPMLFAVQVEEGEKEALQEIKLKVKRSHVGIYFCLILFITLGIVSERILGL